MGVLLTGTCNHCGSRDQIAVDLDGHPVCGLCGAFQGQLLPRGVPNEWEKSRGMMLAADTRYRVTVGRK